MVSKQEISGNGDLYSTINVDDWGVESMIDSTQISKDAGEFICNETLYHTLANNPKQIPCFFLHSEIPTRCQGFGVTVYRQNVTTACIDVEQEHHKDENSWLQDEHQMKSMQVGGSFRRKI